jgi:hypothetical protein
MGFRTVIWSSFTLLPCATCAPGDAIICLRSGEKLVAADGITTLAVQITNFERFREGCGRENYRYTFSYDESLVVPGQTIFPGDISGAFCFDCRAKWTQDEIQRSKVQLVTDTATQTIVEVNDTSTDVLPENLARKGGWVKNISDWNIVVSLSAAAALTEPTILEPGNPLVLGIAGSVVYQGPVTAIHDAAGLQKQLEVVEF